MPKATNQSYTDLQTNLTNLRNLELSARAQGDRELESAARRARRELGRTNAVNVTSERGQG
jgi:hypothetical protein